MTRRLAPWGGTALLWLALLACSGASAQRTSERQCPDIAAAAVPQLQILSAQSVAAGWFAGSDGQILAVPRFCRVAAIGRPTRGSEIRLELWLPSAWNGRYVQLGNGGFAGNISHAALAHEIRSGNAAAMTDTGHRANQFDASWARGNPEKIVDYGYRSIKVTADAARALLARFYGTAARHHYYVGCSNGGRQALMAAQRFPEDWDGIIAGAPAVQWTRQLATFAAIQHRLRSHPGNWIPAAKLPSIQAAAIASCTAAAGLSAGVPAEPRFCRLDSRKLLCPGGERKSCLTARQAATLDLIQNGPVAPRAGRGYHPGFEPSAAAEPHNWDHWIVNPDRTAPSQLAFATQAFRHLFGGPAGWSVEAFKPTDLERALRSSPVLDADDPDLSRFRRRGGRLILYHGWADAVLSPRATINYHDRVVAESGPAATRSFLRLFMVPGMQHCQGGSAPHAFGQSIPAPPLSPHPRHDIRRALEAWVEQGDAPDALVAANYVNGKPASGVRATRLLRPF